MITVPFVSIGREECMKSMCLTCSILLKVDTCMESFYFEIFQNS